MARGALPQNEAGLDISVRTHRVGDDVLAIAKIITPCGPVQLVAKADCKTVARILGASGPALHRIAARLATASVMKKAAEVTCDPAKSPAAERLYARLKAKEPQAVESAKLLVSMAQMGDTRAQSGLACLKAACAKDKAVKVAPVSASGCSSHSSGTMDSPLRGASYSPFEIDPFASHTSGLPNAYLGDYPHRPSYPGFPLAPLGGYTPYHPIPYGRAPTSYPPLPMGPYRGMASGIQSRQAATYIAGESGFAPHLPFPFPHSPEGYNIMASGFLSRLPPPFMQSTNLIAGRMKDMATQGMHVLLALGKRK
jgi:hypothetical protein